MKTLEQRARDLAAQSYRAQVAAQNLDSSQYASQDEYVEDHWRDRYLPIVKQEARR